MMGYSVGVYVANADKQAFRDASHRLGVCRDIDEDEFDKGCFDESGMVYVGYSAAHDLVEAIRDVYGQKRDDANGQDEFVVGTERLKALRHVAGALDAIPTLKLAEDVLCSGNEDAAYEIASDWIRGVTEHRCGTTERPMTNGVSIPKLAAVVDRHAQYVHTDTPEERMACARLRQSEDDVRSRAVSENWSDDRRDRALADVRKGYPQPTLRYDEKPTVSVNGIEARASVSVEPCDTEYDVISVDRRNDAIKALMGAVSGDGLSYGFSMSLYDIVSSDIGVIPTIGALGDVGYVCDEAGIASVRFSAGW